MNASTAITDCVASIEQFHRRIYETKQADIAEYIQEEEINEACESMKNLRQAHANKAKDAMLERAYTKGVEAICRLLTGLSLAAGPAVQHEVMLDMASKEDGDVEGVKGLSKPASGRDVEEYILVEKGPFRVLYSIFESVGYYGYTLAGATEEAPGLARILEVADATELKDFGGYTRLAKEPLETGFPLLDTYGEARKDIVCTSIDVHYNQLRQNSENRDAANDSTDESALASVLQYAKAIVDGEMHVYRTVVLPSTVENKKDESTVFRRSCSASYLYVMASVVNRCLELVEAIFREDCAVLETGKGRDSKSSLSVSDAASAVAIALRMTNEVQVLGPSLETLCELELGDGQTSGKSSLAAALCFSLQQTTARNTAQVLENLSKAFQYDPLMGPVDRPLDAGLSAACSETVRAIQWISPFANAYKVVSKIW